MEAKGVIKPKETTKKKQRWPLAQIFEDVIFVFSYMIVNYEINCMNVITRACILMFIFYGENVFLIFQISQIMLRKLEIMFSQNAV